MEYVELFRQLQIKNIKYLICGGLAVNIYGIPRMTADIDILLDFEESNIIAFENTIKLLGYLNSIPMPLRSLIDKSVREKVTREKNMIAYSYYNSRTGYATLDVLVDVPLEFDELWNVREVRQQENLEINLISLNHLVELKKYANRKQDIDDIFLLSKLI